MKKVYLLLLTVSFFLFTNSNSQIVSLTGPAYLQDFNTLVLGGTSGTVTTGWFFAESGTNANTLYTAGTGSGNAGDTYSFGAASNTERAFGGLQSGSLNPTTGAALTNNTGKQWRLGATGRTDSRTTFTLSIQNNNELPVSIRIFDLQGREINRIGNVSANSVVNLGNNLKTGFYMAEIIQGEERKIVKLVKIL